MRYRGFIITSRYDSAIERNNPESGKKEVCPGFCCQVFDGNDSDFKQQIGYFCLAVGHEIKDISNEELDRGIIRYVEDNRFALEADRDAARKDHLENMLGRAVCFIGEYHSGAELYETLSDEIGMTDDDIRAAGFKTLVPFFDRDCYAKTIAEYMTDTGTGRTRSGNYHFEFSEINESFGIDLPSDSDMLDKIVSSLDSEIVSDVDTTEDFDLMFYLKYCPYAESDEEMEESEINSDMTMQ